MDVIVAIAASHFVLEPDGVAHLMYRFVHCAGSCVHVQIDGLRSTYPSDVGIATLVRRRRLASEDYVIGLVSPGNTADWRSAGIILNGILDELPQRRWHGGADGVGNGSIGPQIAGISDEGSVFRSPRFGRGGEGRAVRYIPDAQNHVSLPDCRPVHYLVHDLSAVPPSGMGLGCHGAYH